MKEELDILDIQEQRRKEDLLLEKELRLLKFEEEVEQKALKKKLILKDEEKGEIMNKNERIISSEEEYDSDRNEDEGENGGKEKGRSLFIQNK